MLSEYYRLSRFTRRFFDVSLESSPEEWLAEAPRHPVFLLAPSKDTSSPEDGKRPSSPEKTPASS